MSDDDLNGLSEDEFELVEHPHEEVTHVDRPRYTSPVSDVEETENPPLTTDALANLVGPAAGLNCRSHGRAPVHTYGSMRGFGFVTYTRPASLYVVFFPFTSLTTSPSPDTPPIIKLPSDHRGDTFDP